MDESVKVLDVEIETLSSVLQSFSEKFNESSMNSLTKDVRTGLERNYWDRVKDLLKECEHTLRTLRSILQEVKGSADWFLTKGWVTLKLKGRSAEIGRHQRVLRAYVISLQFSLQVLTLYCYSKS